MDSVPQPDFNRSQFGSDFEWGVATAAFQIEGNYDVDGKGLSIWDVFTARKGKIKNGDHAKTACDFYRLYPQDISISKALNIPNFRFSLSWTRIMPTGTLPVNQLGVDYYNRVIDSFLQQGITPWVTLYHWDLPQDLEKDGGWTNRNSIQWFEDYVALCAALFGDRVKNWIVMNEPSVFTGAGYFLGIHAPGKKGMTNYLRALHHVTLATAAGAKILRKDVSEAHIGTTFSFTHITAASAKQKDVKAAARVDTLLNRIFLEPVLGLGYPQKDLSFLKQIEKYVQDGDENNMSFDFDFIGLQCYTREVVAHSLFTPYISAKLVMAPKRKVPYTSMDWEVFPESIYALLKKVDSYKGVRKIIVTENGAAFPDNVEDGTVSDFRRTQYIQDHLVQVLRAKNEGVAVAGYFIWTLMDNFEWAEGYHPRFGLVYVDFETQQRIIKQSGYWYRDFLGTMEKTSNPNQL